MGVIVPATLCQLDGIAADAHIVPTQMHVAERTENSARRGYPVQDCVPSQRHAEQQELTLTHNVCIRRPDRGGGLAGWLAEAGWLRLQLDPSDPKVTQAKSE